MSLARLWKGVTIFWRGPSCFLKQQTRWRQSCPTKPMNIRYVMSWGKYDHFHALCLKHVPPSPLLSIIRTSQAVVDARHKDQAETAAENQHQKKMADKQRQPKGKDIGNQKVAHIHVGKLLWSFILSYFILQEFRGAVINGSSLITTYADMRAFVPRSAFSCLLLCHSQCACLCSFLRASTYNQYMLL